MSTTDRYPAKLGRNDAQTMQLILACIKYGARDGVDCLGPDARGHPAVRTPGR